MVKEQSLSVLIGKCDDVFSDFIRIRDASDNGIVYCFICGKMVYWKQAHCLHYITRSKMPTRFDEMNCNAGCEECNCFDVQHALRYLEAMRVKYGFKQMVELTRKSKRLAKFTRPELQELISTYREKVKELRKQKHL